MVNGILLLLVVILVVLPILLASYEYILLPLTKIGAVLVFPVWLWIFGLSKVFPKLKPKADKVHALISFLFFYGMV